MSIEQIQQKPLYTCSPMELALDESANEDESRAVFNGVAITTGYNSRHYRFSLKSVQSLGRQAKKTQGQNGVPLYVMHTAYWELPIGRTLTGLIRRNKELEVSAYIKRNVPDPDTNSIIDRISDDTIDSLSIGWALTDESYFQCDTCKEKMDRGYFMPYCKNYHYPGKKLEGGKICTATVHGLIRFRELSIVGIGADPRAKILQDAEYQDALREEFNALSIKPHDIPIISELSGWDEGMFSESLSFFPMNKGVPTMSQPTHEPTAEQIAEQTATPSQADRHWEEKYNTTRTELDTLKEKYEDGLTREEHLETTADLRQQLSDTTQSLQEAQDAVRENHHLVSIGRVALELERDRAERAYKFFKAGKIDDPISQSELKQLQGSTDLKWLRSEADKYWRLSDQHKNTRGYEDERAPRTQKSWLEGVEANI